MGQRNRQRLLEMVRGEDGNRVPLWRIVFDGDPPREPEYIDGDEVEKLFPSDGDDGRVRYSLLFGCPDESREEVLRDKPCLVRQPDGRFVAQNVGKEGPVYIVE